MGVPLDKELLGLVMQDFDEGMGAFASYALVFAWISFWCGIVYCFVSCCARDGAPSAQRPKTFLMKKPRTAYALFLWVLVGIWFTAWEIAEATEASRGDVGLDSVLGGSLFIAFMLYLCSVPLGVAYIWVMEKERYPPFSCMGFLVLSFKTVLPVFVLTAVVGPMVVIFSMVMFFDKNPNDHAEALGILFLWGGGGCIFFCAGFVFDACCGYDDGYVKIGED